MSAYYIKLAKGDQTRSFKKFYHMAMYEFFENQVYRYDIGENLTHEIVETLMKDGYKLEEIL